MLTAGDLKAIKNLITPLEKRFDKLEDQLVRIESNVKFIWNKSIDNDKKFDRLQASLDAHSAKSERENNRLQKSINTVLGFAEDETRRIKSKLPQLNFG